VRLRKALLKAGYAYGYDEKILATMPDRCRAIAGDVNAELCGIAPQSLPRVQQFWHSAASLRYEDRYSLEIFQTNTEGTRHAIALARHIGLEQYFNYISTAYVAGRRTGLIMETLDENHPTNNHYEMSKMLAEQILANTPDLCTRIFRPSVVIGHSKTFAVASGFSGLYGFIRKLLQFKGAMSRIQEGLLTREAIRMHVDPDAPLNFVPIDLVAQQAVQISTSRTPCSIFHLTNATPPTVAEFLFPLFEDLGLKAPLFAKTKEEFSWIDSKLDQGITFYNSYLTSPKQFDRYNSDVAIGNRWQAAYSLDTATLRSFFHWYLDVLSVQRPRLAVTR
jgi:nucleoside-diphosphate-sugar epimerase